ncbi:helix-turn-helix transcriptional regulator [Cellulomonas sp.]|uniref:response regulator transcription factor n=1 Tax=Cellulomonas sp. TaxID=40001 RepID=UPI0025BB440A|nr:helix-turn-helix transcriptional regulator [Cellulomonas sp.]
MRTPGTPDVVEGLCAHVVARGDALLSPAATRSLIERLLGEPRDPAGTDDQPFAGRVPGLRDREREILALVGEGRFNDEIADHLVFSPHTVKSHVNRAMMKPEAHDRAQLVVIAYESGLLRKR